MISRTIPKFPNINKMADIITLTDYLEDGSWLSESGQYNRVEFILDLLLSDSDYETFVKLANEKKHDDLYDLFNDRISFKIHPFSSNSMDHLITVDGSSYCLVGNESQFKSQFKSLIREKRLSEILRKGGE